MVHIETFLVEEDMLALINRERIACGAVPLQENPAVRRAHAEHLLDWLIDGDPDLYDAPEAFDERARAVSDLGVEVIHDRLACFDLELGDMLDPDVVVPDALIDAMVESLLESPSFAGPLRDPSATHVGLIVMHQSIATEPVSWRTWVGALLVRRMLAEE